MEEPGLGPLGRRALPASALSEPGWGLGGHRHSGPSCPGILMRRASMINSPGAADVRSGPRGGGEGRSQQSRLDCRRWEPFCACW